MLHEFTLSPSLIPQHTIHNETNFIYIYIYLYEKKFVVYMMWY